MIKRRCEICRVDFQLQIQLNQHNKNLHSQPDPVKVGINSVNSSLKIVTTPTLGSTLTSSNKNDLERRPQNKSGSTIVKKRIKSSNVGLLNGNCSKSSKDQKISSSSQRINKKNCGNSPTRLRHQFVKTKGQRHCSPPKVRNCKQSSSISEKLRKSQRVGKSSTHNSKSRRNAESPNQKHPCLICKKTLSNKKLLAIHLRKFHSAKGNNDISLLPARAPVIMREPPSWLKPWTCKKCGKHLSSHHKLWKHRINICGLGTTYRCPYCPNEFRQFIDLCMHRRIHNSRGQLRLKVKQTKSDFPVSPIRGFTRGMDDDKLIECRLYGCEYKLQGKTKLSEHMEKIHRLFVCPQCPSILTEKERLLGHMERVHNSTWVSSAKECPINTSTTNLSESAFGAQKEKFSGVRFKKDDAQSVFHGKESAGLEGAKSSVSTVINKTTLTCEDCKLNFTILGQYLKHVKEHKSAHLPFADCDDLFKNDFNLQNNCSNDSSDLKPTETDIFDEIEALFMNDSYSIKKRKSETDTSSLYSDDSNDSRKRTKKNLPSSPFKCGICSQEFSKDKSFFYHMCQPTCNPKEYLYNCDECLQGFSRETSWKLHLKIQHDLPDELLNVMEERCKICNKIFESAQSVRRHMTNLHPEIQQGQLISDLEGFSTPTTPLETVSKSSTESEMFKLAMPPSTTNRKRSLTPEIRSVSVKLTRIQTQAHVSNPTVLESKKKIQSAGKCDVSEIFLKCPICDLGGFKSRSDITTHAKNKHRKTGPYRCSYNSCPTVCETVVELCDHVVIHEDQVNVPPSSPPPVANTSNHIKFPCMQMNCSDSFSSVHELADHLERSHPDHQFSICPRPYCRIPFRSNKLLRRHLQEHGKN